MRVNLKLRKKSSSQSETGNAKNVANFNKLVSYCIAYGESYNPSNTSIGIEALKAQQIESKKALNIVNETLPVYNSAIAAREVVFKPMGKLITRVINSLKAASPNSEITKRVLSLVRKLRGLRISAKLTDEEKQELIAQGKEVNEISSSQLSFDNRINNFDKFINLLAAIPEYKPNEPELQTAALTTLLESLRVKNEAVVQTSIQLSNARIARNDILYKPNTGIIDTALNVKAYVKSLYGASSPQYHQLTALYFKRQ
ncbi:MAG: hypothetical protein MI739_07110 [Bacteroidales bacterium]|nr:hypothetical protein [Bacteroidales bacterium]